MSALSSQEPRNEKIGQENHRSEHQNRKRKPSPRCGPYERFPREHRKIQLPIKPSHLFENQLIHHLLPNPQLRGKKRFASGEPVSAAAYKIIACAAAILPYTQRRSSRRRNARSERRKLNERKGTKRNDKKCFHPRGGAARARAT